MYSWIQDQQLKNDAQWLILSYQHEQEAYLLVLEIPFL